ncbi:MAG: ParA family protein [Leptonema sp. (in: bacteria)]
MSKTISIINYKGGVGKTTLALQLGLGFSSLYKKKVLLVDLDPQCSLSISSLKDYEWIQHVEDQGSIITLIEEYYSGNSGILSHWLMDVEQDQDVKILPGHLNLPEYEMKLVTSKPMYMSREEFEKSRFLILSQSLEKLEQSFDLIFLDCPPNIYMLSRNAILASDYYIIPTIPDFISSYGIPFIYYHIEEFKKNWNHSTEFLGIILNKVKMQKGQLIKEHQQEYNHLAQKFHQKIFHSFITDKILMSSIMRKKVNIFKETSKKYLNIQNEFINLIKELSGFLYS